MAGTLSEDPSAQPRPLPAREGPASEAVTVPAALAGGWRQLPELLAGRFEIEGELGRGGMGHVVAARDRKLERRVAIKFLAGRHDQRALRRFELEARAAGALNHPNVLAVHDVGVHEGEPYLVSELLEGQTLRARLAAGPLPPPLAIDLAAQLGRGLAAAHGKGVIHRDLKPENLFLTGEGRLKILDFGVAKLEHEEDAGGVVGTVGYMSPEQVRGGAVDARSDLFAAGCIAHEMLTGARCFARATPLETATAILEEAPSRLPRSTPAALAAIVRRCLEKRPEDRFQSARELALSLEKLRRAPAARLGWAVAALAIFAAVAVSLRPRPAPLAPGRLLVAVADAANSTGDPGLDGLSVLLGTALEQSRRVSLIHRGRLLETLRRPGKPLPSRLDEPAARAAALKAQAHALLIPAVRNAGAEYELELRGVEPGRNEALFVARERAGGKGAVLDALDRLSDRARKELQEDPKDAAQPRVRVAQTVSASPEAWRQYAEGRRLASEGRAGAHEAYQRALAADADFPLAHLEFAREKLYIDDAGKERHLAAAMRGIDRVPPKERALVEAARAELLHQVGDALQLYDRLIAGWPQDPAGYAGAGYIFVESFADGEGARPYLEKLVSLAALPHPDAIRYLLLLGRLDEGLARARLYAEEAPGRASFGALSVAHRLRGDSPQSLQAARRALASGPGGGRAGIFWSMVAAGAIDELEARLASAKAGPARRDLLALRGRRREAWALIEKSAPPPGAPQRGFYHAMRSDFAWGDGQPDLIWAEAQEMLLIGAPMAVCAPIHLASLGDIERAQRLIGLFAAQDPRWLCLRLHQHLREWKLGDRAAAIRGLRGMWMPQATFHLGEVLAEAGRHEEAVQEFRKFRRWPEWDNNWGAISHAWPLSLYLEAASLDALGRRAEAVALLDRLLDLWKQADAELPALHKARALRARLAL